MQHDSTRSQLMAKKRVTVWRSLSASAMLCMSGGLVVAQEVTPQVEETVVVRGKALTDAEKAKDRLKNVTGTASVVNNADVERGRAANAEDVLAYQPGVFASATSGTGANKISIRGSGLNAFYQGYSLGIKYLYDGLPITGPGGTQEDLLTLGGVDYTEILNGANAFAYTALSLGGAINFVTHTGRSAPGNYVSVEAGSYGYRKYQVSTGGVSKSGDTDYYFAYLHNQRDGFQVNTPNSGEDYIINVGHRINSDLETRLVIRHRGEELMNGSTLSLAQIEEDPTQNRLLSGRRKPGTTLVTSKTTYTVDDKSKIEFGLAYNDYPLDNGWIYSTTPQDWKSTDLSVALRYLRTGDTFFGMPSNSTVSFSDTTLVNGDVTGYNQNTNTGVRTFSQYTQYSGSRDTVLALGNELQLNDKSALTTGLSFIEVDRDVRIESAIRTNTTTNPTAVKYNDRSVAPRVGLRYDANPNLQFFGNASRSVDPPVTWQIGSTGNPFLRPLMPQKGNTVEAGLRANSDIHEGSLAIYRTWLSNELLTVQVAPPTVAQPLGDNVNKNASKTIHQGIEAALSSRLWRSVDGDRLTYRQAYTFSDFHYRNDPQFGKNELPSLPRHVYQGELLLQQASGFYSGLNVRFTSSYYADFANTLEAPSVPIWGAKFGYEEPGKKWKVFLDLRNLGDTHYAAAANTAYIGNVTPGYNFYPGDGFSVYSGVAIRF